MRAPDLFLIALAVLNLLAGAAVRTPLLVVADDVQWFDRSTCEALAFVARRLESHPILLLCGLRDSFASAITDADVPELHLGSLDETAAAALLDMRAGALDPPVRKRLLENAAGHPLALIEHPKALRTEAYGDDTPLPPWLPLTERLDEALIWLASR